MGGHSHTWGAWGIDVLWLDIAGSPRAAVKRSCTRCGKTQYRGDPNRSQLHLTTKASTR